MQVEQGHFSSDSTVLKDFCDGSRFRNHPLFSMHNNAPQIVLYYDDIEVTNQLALIEIFTNLVAYCNFMFEDVELIVYTLQVFLLYAGKYLQSSNHAIQPLPCAKES